MPKEGWARPHAPVLLLVQQRLRTLGTFLRNAAHNRDGFHMKSISGPTLSTV